MVDVDWVAVCVESAYGKVGSLGLQATQTALILVKQGVGSVSSLGSSEGRLSTKVEAERPHRALESSNVRLDVVRHLVLVGPNGFLDLEGLVQHIVPFQLWECGVTMVSDLLLS